MRRITRAVTVLAGLAGLAVMVLLGAEVLGSRSKEATYAGFVPVPSKPAPSFDLEMLDGSGHLQLSAYRGQVVVVSFGASWCSSCREEAPRRQATWSQVKDSGDVQFIGIHIWDNEEDSLAFAEEFGITFPMALDDSGKVGISYGVIGVPETFIIDRSGNLVLRAIGPITTEELERTLVEVTGRNDLLTASGIT